MTQAADEQQFTVLAEIARVLDARGVPFWLRGGWALDFLLGEWTRPHADIDLVARLRDRDTVHHALRAHGLVLERDAPDVAMDFAKDGVSVQVLLAERSPAGKTVVHGHEYWPLADGALDGPVCCLGGVACRVLTPRALLEEKESYQHHRGRPRVTSTSRRWRSCGSWSPPLVRARAVAHGSEHR